VIPRGTRFDHPRLFASERETLLGLLEETEPDAWRLPTPCPGWNVLDLVSHLVGDDLGLLARQRDSHFGTSPPPDALTGDAFSIWLDQLQDSWVQASKRISPAVARGLLAWSGPQVVEMMRAQDPSEVAAHVSWAAGDEAVPRWLDHGRELSEYWIHRQQIQIALGRVPVPAGEVFEAVLDALRWAFPFRLAKLPLHYGSTVVIEMSGTAGGDWVLSLVDGYWDFVSAPVGEVVGRMRLGSDEAWRLLTNNMALEEQSQLDVQGDPDVVEVLLSTRSIIGRPNRA
jgi:uncharacterized protein (TIGR03083 family)